MIKQTLENLGIIVLYKLDDFPIYEDNLTKEHYKNIKWFSICIKY